MSEDRPRKNGLNAFVEEAYVKYGPDVKRYLDRRVEDPETRRDLAHEVWLRILRIPNFTEIREPLAYFYTVTANVIREHRYFRRRDRVSIDSDAMEHAAEHPADLAADVVGDETGRQNALERTLASLPKKYRQVLLLRITEELSYDEIAERMGLSPKTAREYFSRGRLLASRGTPKRKTAKGLVSRALMLASPHKPKRL
jgi:RNA polymerase sigma-70 factor (ECF subfamily)